MINPVQMSYLPHSGKLLFVIFIATLLPAEIFAQSQPEHKAVTMAVLDYVEGIYEVAPERIERSVAKDLAKVGYWRAPEENNYDESTMSYEQLVKLAGSWNAEGRVDAAEAPKKIEVLDILDQTAVVKLSAAWGIDYLNLAKIDGRWMIKNVLWQSYPPQSP